MSVIRASRAGADATAAATGRDGARSANPFPPSRSARRERPLEYARRRLAAAAVDHRVKNLLRHDIDKPERPRRDAEGADRESADDHERPGKDPIEDSEELTCGRPAAWIDQPPQHQAHERDHNEPHDDKECLLGRRVIGAGDHRHQLSTMRARQPLDNSDSAPLALAAQHPDRRRRSHRPSLSQTKSAAYSILRIEGVVCSEKPTADRLRARAKEHRRHAASNGRALKIAPILPNAGYSSGSWLCKNDFGAPSSATLIQADNGSRTKDSCGTRAGFLYCVATAVVGVFTQPGSRAAVQTAVGDGRSPFHCGRSTPCAGHAAARPQLPDQPERCPARKDRAIFGLSQCDTKLRRSRLCGRRITRSTGSGGLGTAVERPVAGA